MPLVFQPGQAFQFDWSEDWAILGGQRTRLQVAHLKLAYSRAFIVRAYSLQTHEMLFDAHEHAFRVLGGVPQRGIYDNMRTAVDRVGTGKTHIATGIGVHPAQGENAPQGGSLLGGNPGSLLNENQQSGPSHPAATTPRTPASS